MKLIIETDDGEQRIVHLPEYHQHLIGVLLHLERHEQNPAKVLMCAIETGLHVLVREQAKYRVKHSIKTALG